MSVGSDMLRCQKASMEEPSPAEQEERRMSDLSDWASSVTSSAEIRVIKFHIMYCCYDTI